MIVVIVVVDSVRADAPAYAGGDADTATLDRLAREGTWFSRAFASGASTIPSLMSLVTGSFPHRVGVARWRHPFPARRPTLMTAFAQAGFEVRCLHPYPQWGLLNTPGAGSVDDSQDIDAVRAALGAPAGADRLVFIHHWWTHLPYITRQLSAAHWHAACDFALESLQRYPGRIAPILRGSYHHALSFFSENLLPRYLDAASAGGRDVLLVVTSDHGENWGECLPPERRIEHVYDLHGRWIADATIQVPLVVWGKGADGVVPAGRRVDEPVRGVDLAPTVAALAGVPWPGPLPDCSGPQVCDRGIGASGENLHIEGQSLAATITSGAAVPRSDVLTVSSHNTHVPRTYPTKGPALWRTLGLRTFGHWFVWDEIDQRLDIQAVDDGQTTCTEQVVAMRQRLAAECQESVDSGPLIPEGAVEELRRASASAADVVHQRLRTWGYLE